MRLLGLALLGLLSCALAPAGCSVSKPTVLGSVASSAGGSRTGGSGGGGMGSSAGSGLGGSNVVPPSGGGTGDETGEGGACAQAEAQATLVREPIDVIIVLDNSGSMDEELDSVERNIN